jgi:hypothetical protein
MIKIDGTKIYKRFMGLEKRSINTLKPTWYGFIIKRYTKINIYTEIKNIRAKKSAFRL